MINGGSHKLLLHKESSRKRRYFPTTVHHSCRDSSKGFRTFWNVIWCIYLAERWKSKRKADQDDRSDLAKESKCHSCLSDGEVSILDHASFTLTRTIALHYRSKLPTWRKESPPRKISATFPCLYRRACLWLKLEIFMTEGRKVSIVRSMKNETANLSS